MSRSGNVWDNAAMESFFSSLKTERIERKIYRTRNEARADVFEYIERLMSIAGDIHGLPPATTALRGFAVDLRM
jgi:hypothetical protein